MKYADYVRIAPEVKSALRVVDDKLCLGGLTYGQDYSVTLLAGFPSADGSKLADERKVELALGPRPAVITLPGKGFILPRGTAAGLPITTVNVAKLALSVYRVNERGLDKFIDRYDASFPGTEPTTEFYALRQWLNGDNGKRIWRGTMEVRNVLNQPVTTAFPIRETVQDWKPGAYFVVAWNAADGSIRENDSDYGEDDESRKTLAGMWVMDTDIALTTLTGRDGLTVFARSIASAQPLPEHEVVLLSRGNEPIGKAVTGADGRATFPAGLLRGRGAAEATSIMVTDANKQEFSRLELTKAAFDLSDRGIDGRALPGPVDAFLYTERGVYRPGETVQLMAMLRDDSAVALKDMPVTLIVKRPDGSEFTRYTAALPGSGALHQAIDLPKSSRRGLWSVAAYIDPKAAPVGRAEFSVEDFVPEKLKVELSTEGVGPAHRQDDQLRSLGRLPLWRARLGSHGRERPAHHGRSQSLPRLRQVQLRLGRGAQELRAAADHARRAGDRRPGQVAHRMGGRPGQGHRPRPARPDHRPRLRARQRPRHQDRQVAAVAHPRRLSRRQPDLRGPLCPGRHRYRLRPRRPRCRRQADRRRRSTIRSCASPTITSGTRATAAGAGRARRASARSMPAPWR